MIKKTLGAVLAAILASSCASAPPRPPVITPPAPTTQTVTVHVCVETCARDANGVDRKIPNARVHSTLLPDARTDGAGNVDLVLPIGETRSICASAAGFVTSCNELLNNATSLDLALARDVPPILPLTADGRIFRAGGQAWRWKGFSAFALLDRFARGEDISDTLTAYRGFNLARVWPYVPTKDWGVRAWDAPSPSVVVAFLARMARDGFYVELTLLTDDDPSRVGQAAQLVAALKAARPPNLVIEIGNEPQVHKTITTRALQADLDASGFLYASGDSSSLAFGSYITTHTARDGDWPRRAHDLLELWTGGGPDAQTDPAHRMPAVADEPGKIQDVGMNADDFRAYFAACALMGAGATFHSESGKFGLPPTPDEARMAAVALAALNAFPADAPLGAYRRPVENSLRTYAVGNYMVRIRPTTRDAPESGWSALDTEGILWRR